MDRVGQLLHEKHDSRSVETGENPRERGSLSVVRQQRAVSRRLAVSILLAVLGRGK